MVGLAALGYCVLAGAASGEAAAPVKPAVHLVAPSDEYAKQYDSLVAEASLRLVAMELAARHRLYARFWPADGHDTMPADAYPRVELTGLPRPEGLKHVRLKRQGDVFTFFASADGRQYIRIGARRMKMPRSVPVGFTTCALTNQRHLQVEMSSARLNGEPFVNPKRTDYGETRRRSEVVFEHGRWKFHTFGARWRRDLTGVGPFIYKMVEGDFVMDAAVERCSVNLEKTWGFAGVACRGSLKPRAAMVGVFSDGTNAFPGSRARWCKTLWWHEGDGGHILVAVLKTGPEKSTEICRVWAAWHSWDALRTSIVSVADRVEAALAEELQLKTPAAAPTPATEEERQALAEARAQALQVDLTNVRAASKAVSTVLDKSPTCPEGHRTAGLCGAMLACHDLFGFFHNRGRFLAGPVSHLVLAQRLAPAQTAEDQLTCAWVRLACGYPNAAKSILDTLREADKGTAEAKALTMFITRDYRPLDRERVMRVSRIEQLAWVFAAARCGRDALLGADLPVRLARQTQCGGYLPFCGPVNVGRGHVFTSVAPGMAYATDAAAFLTDERLPRQTRLTIGRKMAGALGVPAGDDLDALAEGIAAVAGSGLGERMPAAIAAMMDLYAAAAEQPAGPLTWSDGPRWHVLGLREVAAVRRGWFLYTLYRRARFLRVPLAAPVAAVAFAEKAAAGLEGDANAADYFRFLQMTYAGRKSNAVAALKRVLRSSFGHNLPVLQTIARCGSRPVRNSGPPLKAFLDVPGRGTWEWMLGAQSGVHIYRGGDRGHTCLRLCHRVDTCTADTGHAVVWQEDSAQGLVELAKRMPHALNVARWMAYGAEAFEDKVASCHRLVAMAPSDMTGYYYLAWALEKQGQREKAIETAKQAARNCPFSVRLSNLIGHLSLWLVEENRPKEALLWGQRAARSGSATGLWALATALDANNQTDQALGVYQDLAHRYFKGIHHLTKFLMDSGQPPNRVKEELEALVRVHRSRRDDVAYWAALGFVRGGYTEALKSAFEGPLSFVAADEQTQWLVLSALSGRHYDEAVTYAKQLAQLRPLKPEECLRAYAAATLGKNAEGVEWAKNALRPHRHDRRFRWHARCCLGEIAADDLRHSIWLHEQEAYAHWLIGVHAEARGDKQAALKAYRESAAVPGSPKCLAITERWTKELAASTQPAGTNE